jgi:hypothetical protein
MFFKDPLCHLNTLTHSQAGLDHFTCSPSFLHHSASYVFKYRLISVIFSNGYLANHAAFMREGLACLVYFNQQLGLPNT